MPIYHALHLAWEEHCIPGDPSLVPRPSDWEGGGGGKKAWYPLHAHALRFPYNLPLKCPLKFSSNGIRAQRSLMEKVPGQPHVERSTCPRTPN